MIYEVLCLNWWATSYESLAKKENSTLEDLNQIKYMDRAGAYERTKGDLEILKLKDMSTFVFISKFLASGKLCGCNSGTFHWDFPSGVLNGRYHSIDL